MVLACSAVRVDARQAAELASEALMIREDDARKEGVGLLSWTVLLLLFDNMHQALKCPTSSSKSHVTNMIL